MLKWLFRLVGNLVVGSPIAGFFAFGQLQAESTKNEFYAAMLGTLIAGWVIGWCACWLIDNRHTFTIGI